MTKLEEQSSKLFLIFGPDNPFIIIKDDKIVIDFTKKHVSVTSYDG